MTMGECAVRDQQRLLTDGVCAGSGARMREPCPSRPREPGEDG